MTRTPRSPYLQAQNHSMIKVVIPDQTRLIPEVGQEVFLLVPPWYLGWRTIMNPKVSAIDFYLTNHTEIRQPPVEENVIQVDDITPEQTAAILTPVSPSPSSSALDQRVHSPEGSYTRYSPILSHMSSDDINSSPKSTPTRNSLTTSTNHSRDTARSNSTASQRPPLSPSGSSIHSKPTSLSPGFRTGSPVSFTSISVRDSPQSLRESIPSRASSHSSCHHENDGSQMPARVPPPIRKSMRLASGSIPGKIAAPITINGDSIQQPRNPDPTMQIKKEEEISDTSLIARVTRSSIRIVNQTTAVVIGKGKSSSNT
jgi:hypothetical protein